MAQATCRQGIGDPWTSHITPKASQIHAVFIEPVIPPLKGMSGSVRMMSPAPAIRWSRAFDGMYGDIKPEQVYETVHRALDLGINFFDTAPIYGHEKARSSGRCAIACWAARSAGWLHTGEPRILMYVRLHSHSMAKGHSCQIKGGNSWRHVPKAAVGQVRTLPPVTRERHWPQALLYPHGATAIADRIRVSRRSPGRWTSGV
jgi:hypothetical protein